MSLSAGLDVPVSPSTADTAFDLSDSPIKDLRGSLVTLGAFSALLMAWAATAPLDAAATAIGQITVSGHDQLVANRDGGAVTSISVVEGQHVRAGQVLVELAPGNSGAAVSALRARVMSLRAQHARIIAELENQPRIAWPAGVSNPDPADAATAREAMRVQQAQFDANEGALRAQFGMGASKIQGLMAQIDGDQRQLSSNLHQQGLLNEQLNDVRALADQGYAPKNTVRALERSTAELAGNHDQIAATISQYQHQIAENQFTMQTIHQQRDEALATELRDTEDQLNDATPKLLAALAQLSEATLKARFDGVVNGLTVFSAGSLVAPGQRLLEIVPDHPTLVVEARVNPSDIQGVHVGQRAEIRVLSPSARVMAPLSGTLASISADTLTDPRTGHTYYTAQVNVSAGDLDRVNRQQDGAAAIRPGVPVQVMIPLAKRSALQYLFEPLSQSLWKAFRQR